MTAEIKALRSGAKSPVIDDDLSPHVEEVVAQFRESVEDLKAQGYTPRSAVLLVDGHRGNEYMLRRFVLGRSTDSISTLEMAKNQIMDELFNLR